MSIKDEEVSAEIINVIMKCIKAKSPIPRYFILKFYEEDEEKISIFPDDNKYRFLYHLGEALMEKSCSDADDTLKFLNEIENLPDYSIAVVIEPCGCASKRTLDKEKFEKMIEFIKKNIINDE